MKHDTSTNITLQYNKFKPMQNNFSYSFLQEPASHT